MISGLLFLLIKYLLSNSIAKCSKSTGNALNTIESVEDDRSASIYISLEDVPCRVADGKPVGWRNSQVIDSFHFECGWMYSLVNIDGTPRLGYMSG
jgi:hypothetical protein